MKASEAITLFKTYLNKPRTALPWLKKRPNLYDCAAGYTWIVGQAKRHPNLVWVHELKDRAVKNGTYVSAKNAKGKMPKPGDAIFYDWSGKQADTDHVAMCIKSKRGRNGYINAIGADQGHRRLVTYLNEPKGAFHVISGWGTPFKFDPETTPAETPQPEQATN